MYQLFGKLSTGPPPIASPQVTPIFEAKGYGHAFRGRAQQEARECYNESMLVLITGASGYLGLHCVKAALAAGYRVRATVRQANDAQKCAPIRQLSQPDRRDDLELFSLELASPAERWSSAVSDCTYVLHLASPVILDAAPAERATRVVEPAMQGVRSLLQACAEMPSVKRVVLTSTLDKLANNRRYVFKESDWADPTHPHCGAYEESKIRQELFAHQFMQQVKPHFDLVCICAGFILGPILAPQTGMSVDFVVRTMTGQLPLLPHLYMACVDVRDVARAQVLALTEPELGGRRVIAVGQSVWVKQLAETVQKEFSTKGYNRVSTREAPDWLIRIAGLFMRDLAVLVPLLSKLPHFDNSLFITLLDRDVTLMDQTIIDMANSLIEHGLLPNRSDS